MTLCDSDDDTLSQATYDASLRKCDIFNRLKNLNQGKTTIRMLHQGHCRPSGNKARPFAGNVLNYRLTFTLSGDLRPNPAIFAGQDSRLEMYSPAGVLPDR